MRFPTLLLVAALLAGCASRGTIERDQLADLAEGRTTSTDLARAWGPPLRDAEMPDGQHVWTYRTIHLRTGPTVAFATGLEPIGTGADAMMGQVNLTFDTKGVLQSYTYTR